MRQIKRIFVHCTASSQKWGVKELAAEFKNKGWKNPGYHHVITADGERHQMLSEELVSNGVQGYNSSAVNVAYVGGIDSHGRATDNRTEAQKEALISLLQELRKRYPSAVIMGHRDIWGSDETKWKKMCPCFNARDEYKGIIIAAAFMLMGMITSCKTKTQIVTVPEYHTEYVIRSDTLTRTDSVLVKDSVYIYNMGDTIVINKVAYRDKVRNVYKVRTDTLLRRDSIRVPYPVEAQLSKAQQRYISIGKYTIRGVIILVLAILVSLAVWLARRYIKKK